MSKIGERNKWCSPQEKRLFTCSLCPYSNDLRCRLKLHSETVHNKTIGVHECCDISFTSKEALKNHITTCHRHKYECPVCDKTFVSLLTLRNHQNLAHCDYKKIKCIFCKYATQYKACLKKHMELQHGNRPMYTQCGSVFVKNKSLKQDAATLHRKRYQCDMCDQDFEYPSFLRRHKIMHSKEFKCTICKYATSRKVILMKHMKKHGLDDKHSSSSSLIDNAIPSSENRECPDVEKQPKGFSRKDSVENECQDPAEPHTEYMARLESSSSFIQKNITDSGNVLGIEVRSDDTSSASSAVGVEHPHLQRLSSRQSLPTWTTPSHRLNAIHEEARRLRSQISPSTTLSSILSLLERLLELSASTTIEIRDSVEFEIRSQAIECFDYLWGASKLAVCCWEDIEGSMKSNPSLKAVQYAYGTLPTFIKWQKRKHLEMVEHIILLTVNTVKNCQPQASSTQNERAKRKQL